MARVEYVVTLEKLVVMATTMEMTREMTVILVAAMSQSQHPHYHQDPPDSLHGLFDCERVHADAWRNAPALQSRSFGRVRAEEGLEIAPNHNLTMPADMALAAALRRKTISVKLTSC